MLSTRPASSSRIAATSSGASADEGPVAAGPQAGPFVDELGPGEPDHQHREVADPVDEVLEEVEQAFVGVVEVLDQQEHGLPPSPDPRRSAAIRRTGRTAPAPPRSVARPSKARHAGSPRTRGRPRRRTGRRGRSTASPRSHHGRRRRPRSSRARTISVRAQYAVSSPNRGHEPRCQYTLSASPSTYFSSSQPSRDLPTPAGPVTRARWRLPAT